MNKFLCIVLFFGSAALEAINIKLLRGTHIIAGVPSEYAPFWGLIATECDIAEQLFELSPKYSLKGVKEEVEASPSDYFNVDELIAAIDAQKNNAMQNLVMEMFKIAGGSFVPTNADNNPVKYLSCNQIGQLLSVVSKFKMSPAAKGSVEDQLQSALEAKLVSFGNVRKIKEVPGKVFTAKECRPFAQSLVKALSACQGASPEFPKGTAQMMVLGLMLARANVRADLQEYFRGFLGDAGFALPEDEYSRDEIASCLAGAVDLENKQIFADFICAMVYQQNYTSALPRISSNVSVNYQGFIFSDCVESTMLNLANIATYDVGQTKLGAKLPEGIIISRELSDFYGSASVPAANPAEVFNLKVHQEFTQIVENMVGVIYNRIGIVGGGWDQIEVRLICDGVIPVDWLDESVPKKVLQVGSSNVEYVEKKVGSKTYFLINKNSKVSGSDVVCFELMPNAINVVMMMNHLFGLGLVSSVEELFNPSELKAKFMAMCAKLGWRVDEQLLENIFDGKSLKIPLSLVDNSTAIFTINFHDKAHGFVSVEEQDERLSVKIDEGQLIAASAEAQAALIATNACSFKALAKQGLQYFIPVLNLDSRITMIFHFFDHDLSKYPFMESLVIQGIISFRSISDAYSQQRLLHVFTHAPRLLSPKIIDALNIALSINQLSSLSLLNGLIRRHLVPLDQVAQLIKFLEKGVQSSDCLMQKDATSTIATLIEKNLIAMPDQVTQALMLLEKSILNPFCSFRKPLMEVIKILIEKNLITAQDQVGRALVLLEKCMQSSDEHTKKYAKTCKEELLAQVAKNHKRSGDGMLHAKGPDLKWSGPDKALSDRYLAANTGQA